MVGTTDIKCTPEDWDEVAWVTRCPVNPRADGVATHAEHPAQPVRTAAAVTTLRRGAIVNKYNVPKERLLVLSSCRWAWYGG